MPPKKPTKQAAARAALPTADEAIAFLTEQGKQPMADAVSVLADYTRSSGFVDRPVSGKTVPLYGPKDLFDRARKASTAGLSTDVADGFQQFLDGKWEPKQPATWGSEGEKITTSVRAPEALIEKVKTAVAVYAAEQGLDMRRGYALTAQHIALQWLERLYPADPAAPKDLAEARIAEFLLDPGPPRNATVPHWARDLIKARAAAAGRQITSDVEEAFRAFLAGEFVPTAAPAWSAEDRKSRALLRMSPNNYLHDLAAEAAKDRRAELGWNASPLQIAVAYLLNLYSIDPTQPTAAE